jgi:acetyltransferase
MGPHYLETLLAPTSVAVIGASQRQDSVGSRVFMNLIEAGYTGTLVAVNKKYQEIHGKPCYPSIKAMARPVDVAVVITPGAAVPSVIQECGEHGVKGAVVISAGFREAGSVGEQLEDELLRFARHYGVRIIGPNCLGIMRPSLGLNATFSHNAATAGDLALVSQSGALCTSILDWALANGVGFSSMISMGDAADVDFGEILDYLSADPATKSILLYIEGIRNSRRFMSGLRVAARMKPVVVVKAGRSQEGARAAASHTGALVGSDDVFDAALQRAGVVRVHSIRQLFEAARILSSGYRAEGNRLAVVTNAGGPGVMAADRAPEVGVSIVDLSPETIQELSALLPSHWSKRNPVDILGDAPPARYKDAIRLCAQDERVDGVLAIFTPQAMSNATEAGRNVVEAAAKSRKPTIACWMGEAQVADARQHFLENRVPSFSTPESATEAFSYLTQYRRNQQLLLQVPGPLSERRQPDVEGARLVIEGALSSGRTVLTTTESKAVLAAFHIPTMPAVEVGSANEALVAAESMGFPVVMKINSFDITHKSDVGGVRLNIDSARGVRSAFNDMVAEVRRARPKATIRGVTVERMCQKRFGRELMAGVVSDPVFGPIVSFGAGGVAVEVMRDRVVALPPLNELIVRDLIAQTRVARLLDAFRNAPAANIKALEKVLLRVSEMACELPHVRELDINPLIVDEEDVVAVDARVIVAYPSMAADRYAHMGIHPYPNHLVSHFQLADGTNMVLRPIRPEDAQIEDTFVRNLSPEAKYFRFMRALHELSPEMLVRFTQIDYDREMAFIVTTDGDKEEEVAVGRYVTNPDGKSCEFALVVGDAWRRKGIGTRIMRGLMDVAKARGLETMNGEILSDNRNMLSLMKQLGFTVRAFDDDPSVHEAWKKL